MTTQSRRAPSLDERTISGENRAFGFLGPRSSSFTLAWLATHRDRLRTLLLGGKRLSVLVVWDTKGTADACRSEADIVAVRQIVYGDGEEADHRPDLHGSYGPSESSQLS